MIDELARAAKSAAVSACLTAVLLGCSAEPPDARANNVNVDQQEAAASPHSECAAPEPGWIFCDDFEQDRLSRYFEYDNADGRFARASGVGHDSSYGMRARFDAGSVGAGSLKLAFGKTPQSYFRAVDAGIANYREVYWRVFVRNAPGWIGGGGHKLTRATVFGSTSEWAQAMIAHVWSGGKGSAYLVIDPASGTNAAGALQTTTYNDFDRLRWLGAAIGKTPIFDAARIGEWHCVEVHVKLNDAGQANGAFQLWVNDNLEASRSDLDWLGRYNAYGINAIFFENYWNDGSPVAQERYLDRIVVSGERVGC